MSEAVQKITYPKSKEEIETEKEIIDAIKKITPASQKLRAFAINSNLLRLKEYDVAEQDEIAIVDSKGNKKFEPTQAHINDLANSARQPTAEELGDLSQYFTAEELEKKDELLNNLKPIADYWLTAFKNHGMLSNTPQKFSDLLESVVKEHDEPVLKTLRRVEYKSSENAEKPLNFSVHFHFDQNDYFENQTLSVSLEIDEPREASKITGTDIKWKAGKNVTKKSIQKKQRNKKTGQTRTVTKEEDVESFFNLFKTLEKKEHEHKEDDDEDEEFHKEEDQLYENVETAYSLFEEIIPFSLEYFLNVRKDFDDGGDEGDDDFEDEDGDDDDDEEEAPKPKKGGKGPKSGNLPAAGDPKKDCKQQ